ncbi:hypothetical protein J437_LFUL004518, partial [Ladona fulva]
MLMMRNLSLLGKQPRRELWGWLNRIFNMVDSSRIQDVGPDRACAEWLLRCGASVKWKGTKEFLKDYNSLPQQGVRFYIQEIDATDSAVMDVGFSHLRGLKYVERIIFHRCGSLEDEAVKQLIFVKDSLKHLQISSCGDVTDEGVLSLSGLTNLQTLLLYDLPEVRNRRKCIEVLENSLPYCKMEFPYAQSD